jgi:hypothetical protein
MLQRYIPSLKVYIVGLKRRADIDRFNGRKWSVVHGGGEILRVESLSSWLAPGFHNFQRKGIVIT